MVLVFGEVEEDGRASRLTVELMGLGGRLASELGCPLEAAIVGSGLQEAAEELLSLGAGRVLATDDPSLAVYNPDSFLAALEATVDGKTPLTVLAGHTPVAQDLMPRLASSIGAGLVTDCVAIDADGTGGLLFAKPVYGGNAQASFRVTSPVRMATVRARVGSVPEPRAADGTGLVSLEPPGSENRVGVLETVKEDGDVKLESARVVVSGGRGMGGLDGFAELEKLAGVLGGAVGASRPPCDSGWAQATSQVGITGKIVAPDLYIAVAISGSSQHLSGMGESEKIVAINQDPDAYIFKVADYGVAGDWRQVLPAFTEGVRKHVQG